MAMRSIRFRILAVFASLAVIGFDSVGGQERSRRRTGREAAAKTPTPADAGDASAVYLFDEYLITVDEQNHAVERERSAVRILKPQGRESAHCDAEYDSDAKLDYFRAWTIAADGRQFQAMETDFSDVGAYEDVGLAVRRPFPGSESSRRAIPAPLWFAKPRCICGPI